jgi:hypothetical protein
MATKAYALIALTGGGTGALDAIDGAALVDGDQAYVVDATANTVYEYTLNSTSAAAASSPTIISPTANAGDKRWELCKSYVKDSITFNDGTNIGLVQFTANVLELYSQRHSGVVRISVEDGAGNKETAATFTGGGSVNLYYDNSVKLATTSTGVTITGAVHETVPSFPRKNFLINGCMRVNQRGNTSISGTATYGAVDRWRASISNVTAGTISQTTTASGATNGYGLYLTGLSCTAGGLLAVEQRIESINSRILNGRTITFSCKLYHNFGSETDFTIYLYEPNGADDYSATTQLGNSGALPCASGSYTQLSFTYTVGAAEATNGLRVQIVSEGLEITTKDCIISDAQLELGTVVTPLEYRPFTEELSLCQRYYEKSYNIGNAPGTVTLDGTDLGRTVLASNYFVSNFTERKRPGVVLTDVSLWSPSTGDINKVRDSSAGADIVPTVEYTSEHNFSFSATLGGVGSLCTWHWAINREL